MTNIKHLWEYDHPYYCNEGNYLHSPVRDRDITVHEELASWEEFKSSGFHEADRDLNLLFRWDWKAWHLVSPEDFPDEEGRTERHELLLFFMLQRKAFNRSISVTVTAADEPEVRAWLAECAKTISALWEPVLGGAA
ncbi:hypothetical protein A6411_23890 [Prescottella equi]|uniref:hypothetical protein n=1 Tax=Rhodococcus hoagii TaxID=43767 RepID=UPI0009BDA3F2|nr:hypothetical protein [Prescottella equi]OQQ23355.1 hypothetical protein A6411_23890 [Prescottella equi]